MISDRGLQFVAELMKKLNKILGIETKLLTAFHLQIDRQIKRINQELEQYLRMYINYKQSNWLEWLATTKFVFNNKVYTTTRSKVNYKRELRMGFKIRKKGKHAKAKKFVKEMKEMYKKTKAALKK